jgi:zinc protease
MAIYVLGGNFSARLMQTIRDEAGLTYGIGSSLSGTGFGSDGYWSIWATFAPDLLEKGKRATRNQIKEWYNNGITEKELNEKKTTIMGAYKVGLDSTGGLAARILSNAQQREKIEHLDKYPEIIKNISLDKVNKTIKKYIKPKQLTFVAAGTFDD